MMDKFLGMIKAIETLTEESPEEQPACERCKWFLQRENTWGYCRFNAPTDDGWPTPNIDDWCGKFKEGTQ